MAYYSTSTTDDGVSVTIDFIQWLRDQREKMSDIDPDHVGPVPSPRQAYDGSVNAIAGALAAVGISTQVTLGPFKLPDLPTGPGGGGPPSATLNPEAILQQIVDGINAAESRLNLQNFVIASGAVEAKLNLPVAGVTISFSITPKPYS